MTAKNSNTAMNSDTIVTVMERERRRVTLI